MDRRFSLRRIGAVFIATGIGSVAGVASVELVTGTGGRVIPTAIASGLVVVGVLLVAIIVRLVRKQNGGQP